MDQKQNPDDDLEGILDRPAPMSRAEIAEAFAPRWVCACGQTFTTDPGFGLHIMDCEVQHAEVARDLRARGLV